MDIMENGIHYQKEEDGCYYPVFEEEQEMKKPLGKYGTLLRDYLRETQPAKFKLMAAHGTLWGHLREMDNQCRERYENLVREIGEKTPQQGSDYLSVVQRARQIEAQADEMVQSWIYQQSN